MSHSRMSVVLVLTVACLPVSAFADDQQIAERVATHIRQSGRLSDYTIKVMFLDGTATLAGNMSTQEQIDVAVQTVREVPEVRHVRSVLRIAREAAETPERPALAANASASTSSPGVKCPQAPAPSRSLATTSAEIKEGPCSIKKQSRFDKDVFTVRVGKMLKATCKFHVGDLLDVEEVLCANPDLSNAADKTMYCSYHVAFFDKDNNLIGCASGGLGTGAGLAPGQTTALDSCLIWLPVGVRDKIASYKLAYYESEDPIGLKK